MSTSLHPWVIPPLEELVATAKPPPRALHRLSRQEHAILKAWGFLTEFYPEATGEWEKDSKEPAPWTDAPWMKHYIDAFTAKVVADLIDKAPVLSDLYKTPTIDVPLETDYYFKIPESAATPPEPGAAP